MSIASTTAESIISAGIIDDNDQTRARVEHLREIETLVGNSYPNKFERSKISGAEDTVSHILHFAPVVEIVKKIKAHVATLAEREKPNQELKESLNARLKELGDVKISGRLTTTPRTMGKAAFVHFSDGVNRLQIYVRRDDAKLVVNGERLAVSEEKSEDANAANDSENSPLNSGWELFKLLDGGDFVGVSGFLFLTNTGELSVHVETLQFLSKALLPMPDKMHGIADPEIKRRYRYADLIASSLQVEHEGLTTREVFERRARLISGMRRYLDDHDFIEVETPMLTPKATGAAAEPFETFHKALGIPLYARIAPELYLKRLMVGGFEKVYELNRNFRNEGLSHKHSPEFTMLEFYVAYMDVNGMMDFAEAMIKDVVMKANDGSLIVKYGENEIDFEKPFERLTMKEAIVKHWRDIWKDVTGEPINIGWLNDKKKTRALMIFVNTWIDSDAENRIMAESVSKILETDKSLSSKKFKDELKNKLAAKAKYYSEGIEKQVETYRELSEEENGRDIIFLFESFVEEQLINPTFIIDYPKSISPLSKASPENPQIAERFELFINGAERANGFSELNDPQEQYERFRDQMTERESGDAEAMVMDEDYIRALAYGMPPAAGIGIGIDRLVMLLTNKHSIRDVILFPHMRPERREEETNEN